MTYRTLHAHSSRTIENLEDLFTSEYHVRMHGKADWAIKRKGTQGPGADLAYLRFDRETKTYRARVRDGRRWRTIEEGPYGRALDAVRDYLVG